MKQDDSILFLGKEGDRLCQKALDLCKKNFTRVTSYMSSGYNQEMPIKAKYWTGDYNISYLNRWILPETLISNALGGAVNFHPAPPEYPGCGCANFALYDEVGIYGATCHYMKPKVDSGDIIKVNRFTVNRHDDLETLLEKSYFFQYLLFEEAIEHILTHKRLPPADPNEKWVGDPTTKKQMEALYEIKPFENGELISENNLKRIIKATSFNKWQPSINLHGYNFTLTCSE